MLTATVNRRLRAIEVLSKEGKRINGLFRLMLNPLLWQQAYANIYANEGALTKGVSPDTMDGFSFQRIENILAQLKAGTYRFRPARRVWIPKPNGRKRPLGVACGNDKLVQEVVRIILERIYEPIFESNSHGFRPGRSPHTALEQIQHDWTAVKWIVDMDLQNYFDTINHDLLVGLLEKKIDDRRFMRVIKALLKAGYLEDWKFHATYSGTPQGSTVSPVLANVMLHELDLFMYKLKQQFDQGKRRRINKSYLRYSNKIRKLRKRWDKLKNWENSAGLIAQIKAKLKQADQARKRLPSGDPFDAEYKRLYYCRYADDYAVGIIGSYKEAEIIRDRVKEFIQQTLKLTIAPEKSHIRHSKEGILFLGYRVKVYSGNRIIRLKRGSRHTTVKAVSERLQLQIPPEKLKKFCQTKKYGNYQTGKTKHRAELLQLSDAEILLAYNAELRGLANYYSLAVNAKRDMNKLSFLWRQSLFKTLAAKHRTTVRKTARKLKTGDGYQLKLKDGQSPKTIKVFRLKDLNPPSPANTHMDKLPNTLAITLSRNEVIKRLNAHKCEYCEREEGGFEVHHIHKLKDVAKGKILWQQMMASRKRKTLVLCEECHQLLHKGKLPEKNYFKLRVEGEPRAFNDASVVRREDDTHPGNG